MMTAETLPEVGSMEHGFHAEHALAACMIEKPDIADQLKPGLFGDLRVVAVHEWITRMRADRKLPSELCQVLHALQLHDHSLFAVMLQWLQLIPSPAGWSYWEEIVREEAVARHATEVSRMLAEGAKAGDLNLTAAIKRLQGLEAAKNRGASTGMTTVWEAAVDDMEQRYTSGRSCTGIPTGFPTLDQRTDGLTEKGLWVIAARPATGKTTLAINLASTLAIDGKVPVLLFSLEMPGHVIAQKLYHLRSRVSIEAMRQRRLTAADFAKLATVHGEASKSPLTIIDNCNTIQSIASELRRLKKQAGLRVAIVDYLQRVGIDGFDGDSWQKIGRVSNTLKDLAMELGITVVALAQLNREVEKEGREPTLADLRGSSEIEADADVVAFLWKDGGKPAMSVGKSRLGTVGRVPLHVDFDTGRMTDPSHTIDPADVPSYEP